MKSLIENLKKHFNKLEKTGPRASGSWKELETAEWILSEFKNMGLEACIQTFESGSHNAVESRIEINGELYESLPSMFSPAGSVCGEVIFLGNTDILPEKISLKGKIGILFPSGKYAYARRDFVLELEKRGMEALIVISQHMDVIETKLLRSEEVKKMPICSVSWHTGNKIISKSGQSASLSVKSCKNPRKSESQNVIASLRSSSPYWLAVSAHHDTAPFVPGILDNGSGTALLLELAKSFSGKTLPASVYFVSTGSEENGGNDGCGAGAKAFYRAMVDKIENCIAHIEIDDIGNIAGIPEIIFRGNKPFCESLMTDEIKKNYRQTESQFLTCDHGAAAKQGVPFVWFTDAMIPRPFLHTPLDTAQYLSIEKCAGYFGHIRSTIEKMASERPFYPFLRKDNLTVRPARFEDIEAVKTITEAAFGPMSMGRMSEDFFGEKLGGKPWHFYKNREVGDYAENNSHLVIVCETEGKTVAYATWLPDPEKGTAQIGNNAVHPDYQGRGIGKLMQQEIFRRMKEDGYRRFMVSTLSVDIPAQKVYEKLGYKKYAESFHYLM